MPEIAHGSLFIGKPLIVFYGSRHYPNSGAYDHDGERYRRDLSVTSVLKNSAGSTVSGSSVVLALKSLSDPSRNGVYEGTMPGTISLSENSTYYLEITVVDGSASLLDFVRIEYTARYQD